MNTGRVTEATLELYGKDVSDHKGWYFVQLGTKVSELGTDLNPLERIEVAVTDVVTNGYTVTVDAQGEPVLSKPTNPRGRIFMTYMGASTSEEGYIVL